MRISLAAVRRCLSLIRKLTTFPVVIPRLRPTSDTAPPQASNRSRTPAATRQNLWSFTPTSNLFFSSPSVSSPNRLRFRIGLGTNMHSAITGGTPAVTSTFLLTLQAIFILSRRIAIRRLSC